MTGFFDQNFRWRVDNITDRREFLLFGLGGLPVPLVALVVWLRRASRDTPPPLARKGSAAAAHPD